jgi:hypothetical protein
MWAREHNCPWDEWICVCAALGRHLDVLKWAREHDSRPWDEWTCAYAAWGRHLGMM